MRRPGPVPAARGLALPAIAALALAGCGGGGASSPAAQRRAVAASVLAYLSGIVHGDGAEVCSHLTPALRSRDTAELNAQLGRSGVADATNGSRSLSCAAAFHKVGSLIPARDRSRTFRVTRVTLDGSTATAMLAGAQEPAHLVEQDGRWLVSVYTTSGS